MYGSRALFGDFFAGCWVVSFFVHLVLVQGSAHLVVSRKTEQCCVLACEPVPCEAKTEVHRVAARTRT